MDMYWEPVALYRQPAVKMFCMGRKSFIQLATSGVVLSHRSLPSSTIRKRPVVRSREKQVWRQTW